MPTTPMVFVLMPFDEAFADVYQELIKPPFEELGYEVQRADSLFNQQQILKDVVKGIADADLVVADVTGLNGNVLYELGLAHALGKRTVMITQQIEELPFDLRPYRANEYSVLFNRASALKELLRDIGNAVLEGNADFSSPVQDFAPYALSVSTQVAAPASRASRQQPRTVGGDSESEPEEDDPEPGLLEAAVSLEAVTDEATTVSEQIAEALSEIAAAIDRHSGRMDQASTNLGDRAAGARLAIVRDAAKDLDSFSDKVEPLNGRLNRVLQDLGKNANVLARESGITDDEDAQAVVRLIETLRETEGGFEEARIGAMSFTQSLLGLPNVDRVLVKSARRAGKILASTSEAIEGGESELARARGVLTERLDVYNSHLVNPIADQ